MLNLFRNLLLNKTERQLSASTITEVVPPDWHPRVYPSAVEQVRVILVGEGSISEQCFRALMALRSAYSTELCVYLKDSDNIFTFDPLSVKYFNSDFTFDLVDIDARLQKLSSISKFLALARKRLVKTDYDGLVYVFKTHDSPVWRVAAAVVLFLLTAENQT